MSHIFAARYALLPSREIIENARLVVEEGRIAEVVASPARAVGREVATDLGDALLLPGFVNAHAHLELTLLRGAVPFRGSFAGWIEALLAVYPRDDREWARRSVRAGIRESLAAGVTMVGDIGYGGHQVEEISRSLLRAVCFVETLGIGRRAAQAEQMLRSRLEGVSASPPRVWLGLAPHAPYTTSAEAYRWCVREAQRRGWLVCTHLAETREEVEFLRRGTGPLRDLLERRGWWSDEIAIPGVSPVRFARQVGLLDRPSVLVHMNYVDEHDIALLAGRPISVVYCPRAHRFFGHENHPWQRLVEAGVNVCVGTDSLASNTSLSVLDELRFVYREEPAADARALLGMGTVAGARALGVGDLVGELRAGRLADLVAVPVGACRRAEAAEAVLATEADPSHVVIGGHVVWPAGDDGSAGDDSPVGGAAGVREHGEA